MMKKITPFAVAAIMISACDNTPQFHVEGVIEGAEDSILRLEANTLDGIKELDNVKLGKDGKFEFSATAPANPEFYCLRIGGKRINFSIDSTETVKFKADYTTMEKDYAVEGSENAAKIKEISAQQRKLQEQIIALEKNSSMYPGDIADSIKSLINSYKEKMKNEYIFKNPGEASAYYAVCQSVTDLNGSFMLFNPVSDRTDVKCYAAVATAWDGLYPDAKRTEQLCNAAINGMKNTAPPTQKIVELDESKISETGILEVELPDINGNIKKLTSLKGKVVILDFTIYGAKESAQRTRIMRELYNKYKDKGLEIYQVSLDDDLHFWKFSCENLPWVCVHETDGRATGIYGVSSVPTFFIINRDNEIVVRSDMMKGTMEDEILKLL